ncbi:MAG TPA: hypothetical protein VE974_04605 [Thermoanaerobaculia bacterium]|nr:hypothetical protein [Thermoanaerobaculia bacterium]
MSFDDERPHLVLNSAIASGSFKGLLHDKTQKGSTAALRTMVTLGIAESVWLKLFFAAAAAVAVDETTGEITPPEGWRGALLTRFLSTAFPELPSVDDKLQRLAELKREPDQFLSLLTRLGSPLFETLGSAKLIQKALKQVEI